MDPLHLCVALGPVAAYLLMLGAINLRERPLLVNGFRDTAVLGMAISGCVIAGPFELFFPETASARFGPYTWLMLVSMYALLVTLVVLMLRPRLVIYNITTERLRPMLSQVIHELDAQSRWAGDSVVLPNAGIQMHVERSPFMRNVQLVSTGNQQNFGNWRRLEQLLRAELPAIETRPNTGGALYVAVSLLLLLAIGKALTGDPGSVVTALRDMLRIY